MLKTIKALALAGAMISCASAAAAQTRGSYVEVPGGKLWTESCGSGAQTLVLIHDGVLHSVGWDDVWPALCKSFHVIRYDRRGYGRSPEAKAPYSRIDDLQAVMDEAEVKHAAIVGASNGGGLAIDFALAHPGEVDSLILIGPEVPGLPHSKAFMDRQAELGGRMARLDFMGAIKGSWLFAPGDDADAARLLKLELGSLQDLTHKETALPDPEAADRLGEIKAPTLVIVGEADHADNQAQAGVVEYAVPGATRVVVHKAGHLVYMAQPAEFTDLVSRFVTGTQIPSAEAETALRHALEGLQRGAPDYASFIPALAPVLRQQIEPLESQLEPMGAIRSAVFKGQGPGGADIFIVGYDKGSLDARITLGPDGKIAGLFFKPAPPSASR